ncbi:acyltransferase [Weissella halotolerans]|uniref:Serine acetyltransferase n=1 Tax=Weissella halotolerans DSM 20190 TaxID=1123500 RepID=A0A0R2FZQ3_9LACO|nr:acyltransferase [Weissella halotolerans]KRN33438.1 hypothetical protein IV68_GL000238 [Weissella halotolerans DSM 20190]
MNRKQLKNKLVQVIMGLDGRVQFSDYVWQDVRLQPEYWSKWLVFIYRLGRINLYYSKPHSVRKKIWRKIYLKLNIKVTEGKLNSHLPASAYIGQGSKFFHPYGVIINSHAYVGGHSVFRHNVTIGNLGQGSQDSPRIEYRASFGSGSTLIGPIHIGHHATTGANAVVTKSFPDYAVIVGVPGKNIRQK